MPRPTGDGNDEYEDYDGVAATFPSPSGDTSFYLFFGTLGTKKHKMQNVITCGSNSR